jgi:hypothetical protein
MVTRGIRSSEEAELMAASEGSEIGVVYELPSYCRER